MSQTPLISQCISYFSVLLCNLKFHWFINKFQKKVLHPQSKTIILVEGKKKKNPENFILQSDWKLANMEGPTVSHHLTRGTWASTGFDIQRSCHKEGSWPVIHNSQQISLKVRALQFQGKFSILSHNPSFDNITHSFQAERKVFKRQGINFIC